MNTNHELLEFLCSKIEAAIDKRMHQIEVSIQKRVTQIEEKVKASMSCPELRRVWIPRDEVKLFLEYGDTQLSVITKEYKLVTTEIGRRKFYSTSSLFNALNKK